MVLGHSGTTGADSDPAHPGTDARRNSWATGDNPAVNSVYTRLLALNPAVRGHNTNLGVDGSDTDDLGGQVDQALALTPVPALFMIQEVDNDMKCDGTDPDNYPHFARTLSGFLAKITAKAPDATILLVSSPPGTVQNYGEIVSRLPTPKAANTAPARATCSIPRVRPSRRIGATKVRSFSITTSSSTPCASDFRPADTTAGRSTAW